MQRNLLDGTCGRNETCTCSIPTHCEDKVLQAENPKAWAVEQNIYLIVFVPHTLAQKQSFSQPPQH